MSNEERYRERVKDAFENFLVSRFIEYKPYFMSDEVIVTDAKDRSNINFDGGRLRWYPKKNVTLLIIKEYKQG